MKLDSFIRDLHAVTKASINDDPILLKTPSGKIKQDTFFERAIGLGKKVLAKIQGKSYELRPISYDEGKKEIETRLINQFFFLSESKHLDETHRTRLISSAETFVNRMSAFNDFSKNPEKAFFEQIEKETNLSSFQKDDPLMKAYSNIKDIYQEINDPKKFKIKARLFEEHYAKSLQANLRRTASIDAEQRKKIDELSTLASYVMKSHGKPMGDAITLAKIMHRKEVSDMNDLAFSYEIAKTFADRHLQKNQPTVESTGTIKKEDQEKVNSEMSAAEFSKNLEEAKNVVQVKALSKKCLSYLQDKKISIDQQQTAMRMALILHEKNLSSSKEHMEEAFACARNIAASGLSRRFEEELRQGIFNERAARVMVEYMTSK